MKSVSSRSSKIASLLGLSAGAVASTQMAEAQIIYSGEINEQVGFTSGFGVSYTLDVPGTADLQLVRSSQGATAYAPGFKAVDFKQLNGYAQVKGFNSASANFATRNPAGATWNEISGGAPATGRIGWRNTAALNAGGAVTVKGPGDFTSQYVAFSFLDSTNGNALRYGWAELSMVISTTGGPDVTLSGWAYEASGATIAMGDTTAIPEPGSTAAIIGFGALALGGVRRWRSSKKENATVAAS